MSNTLLDRIRERRAGAAHYLDPDRPGADPHLRRAVELWGRLGLRRKMSAAWMMACTDFAPPKSDEERQARDAESPAQKRKRDLDAAMVLVEAAVVDPGQLSRETVEAMADEDGEAFFALSAEVSFALGLGPKAEVVAERTFLPGSEGPEATPS